eukprot:12420071-Karenia_brevis.AAC.1
MAAGEAPGELMGPHGIVGGMGSAVSTGHNLMITAETKKADKEMAEMRNGSESGAWVSSFRGPQRTLLFNLLPGDIIEFVVF